MESPHTLPANTDPVKLHRLDPRRFYPVHAVHTALSALSALAAPTPALAQQRSDAILGLARWVATAPGWPTRCPDCGKQTIASPEWIARQIASAKDEER